MSDQLDVVGLGRMSYGEALILQRAAAHARIDGTLPHDTLFLVEHPPVITLGRTADPSHLVVTEDVLRARGVELWEIERGGDITFHGPGQLVGYPVFHLEEHQPDLHVFLRQLESVIMHVLGAFGLVSERRQDLTGVWTSHRKIASIGIHVRKWVTWHGFALNVTTDLDYFELMIPCGIPEVTMTSIQRELGGAAPRDLWGLALDRVLIAFAEVFQQQPQAVTEDDLRSRLTHHFEKTREYPHAGPKLI